MDNRRTETSQQKINSMPAPRALAPRHACCGRGDPDVFLPSHSYLIGNFSATQARKSARKGARFCLMTSNAFEKSELIPVGKKYQQVNRGISS